MSDQVAFMVMPFGKKAPFEAGGSVPAEVDFDALWHRVHKPVLEMLNDRPVRADRDMSLRALRRKPEVTDSIVTEIDSLIGPVSADEGSVCFGTGIASPGPDHGQAAMPRRQHRSKSSTLPWR